MTASPRAEFSIAHRGRRFRVVVDHGADDEHGGAILRAVTARLAELAAPRAPIAEAAE